MSSLLQTPPQNTTYSLYQFFIQRLFEDTDTACFAHISEIDGKKNVGHGFISGADARDEGVFNQLLEYNKSANIYVGMNPFKDELRGQKLGRTEANVAKIKRLYADADVNGRESYEKLTTSTKLPKPHFVLESSPGKYQFIWNVDGLAQDTAKRLLKAIAQELGTDTAVAETARVLRIPGFANCKYAGRPVVKIVDDFGANPYRLEDFKLDVFTNADTFEKKPEGWLDEPFIHGRLDNQICSFIGHYVSADNIKNPDTLYDLLEKRIADNGCYEPDGVTPFSCNMERVRELCDLKVKEWKTGEEKRKAAEIVLNQKPDVQPAATVATAAPAAIPEIDTSEGYIRPVFPYWAIQGTSIWDGLVAPALKTSSKHAEFIAMPAIQIMLNALSGRVQIGLGNSNHNIFLGLISPYGEFFKSSSCTLAMDYFKHMGKLFSSKTDKDAAEGRIAVIQAGSPEGFGLRANKINAARALLFNDELSKFVSKAGIEGSSFSSDLLTWYGAGEFGNGTSQTKNAFHFEAGKYTFGWLWATTDRTFNRCWPKLAGISSGLEDRMFFVVSPEKPKPTTPYSDPLFQDASQETAKLIEKAIVQQTFNFEDPDWYAKRVSGMSPRSMDLVQKLCLYLCVDMGGTVIEDEHIDRALDLVKYRDQAAKFLEPIEAVDDGGRLQKEILRELRQNKGKMKYRDLCRAMDYTSMEVFKWDRIFNGLKGAGLIHDFHETTTPGKRATRMVGLAKQEED